MDNLQGIISGSAVIGGIVVSYYIKSLLEDFKEIARKINDLITSHEVNKAAVKVELENIKLKIIEIEKRLDRVEEK